MTAERPTQRPRDLRVARVLITVIAVVLALVGAASIAAGAFHGRTRGGTDVYVSGTPATSMGWLYVAVGLMPLGVWFRRPWQAAVWGTLCAAAVLGLLAFGVLRPA